MPVDNTWTDDYYQGREARDRTVLPFLRFESRIRVAIPGLTSRGHEHGSGNQGARSLYK
jgi:hypothetical protein